MRMSRVLLVGVAVAGAAVTTSAFTASNTFTAVDNNVAGYGELVVSGAIVTNIAYTPAADATKLASVVFTSDENITGTSATMILTNGGSAVAASASTCVVGAWNAGTTSQPITCTLTTPVAFVDFDKTGLTVVSQ
jgi:hypothetical protein